MNPQLIKDFLTACRQSKQIENLMPALPKGMSPKHIQIVDVIQGLQTKSTQVRVSDVSAKLHTTKPSITKAINELVALNVVTKQADKQDRRIYWVRLTQLGQEYYQYYIGDYHQYLTQLFAPIDPADLATTIKTIDRVYDLMQGHKQDIQQFGLPEEKRYADDKK